MTVKYNFAAVINGTLLMKASYRKEKHVRSTETLLK